MYRLSSLMFWLSLAAPLLAQSPHGANFRVNCADCHLTTGWEIPYDAWDREGPVFSKTTGWQIGWDTAKFSHTKTRFPLTGQHVRVDCRGCHQSMVFSEAKSDCFACHQDVHQRTVGADCARCHSTENWLVDVIPELHQDNGFPLLGAHTFAACADCHKSETGLRFDRLGNDCINCHQMDYAATASPNHQAAGFSTQCADCHDVSRFDWTTSKVRHDFFPLTKGHDIADCARCHTNGSYSNTPSDCIACHQTDFETASNPNHTASNFSQNCIECHTTDPDWMPAKFAQHDALYFPIYSGKHKGEWDQCADCHTDPTNFAVFSCTTCHTNPETDNHHTGITGYTYNSPACLACHPNGDGSDGFDHNKTQFPLKGAHVTVDCKQCHVSTYTGTPTACVSCHLDDYNATTDPNHATSQFPQDCALCHTETGWTPASFDHNLTKFPLKGAHVSTACVECHASGYTGTPTACVSCHLPDYNATTDPNHAASQFPQDCALCHTESGWTPATFDHNMTKFPLKGAHVSTACVECHASGYTGTPTDCASCHMADYNQTNSPQHTSAGFPTTCADCHTESGWTPATFDHDDMYFPIYSGKHRNKWDQCSDCHTVAGNYAVFSCTTCHTKNKTDGDHNGVNGYMYSSPACLSCHPKGN
ncbi:MAG: hypothetical protein KDD14_04865 [Saprospiraceae bacterium]|nr:hypothetical protein [Saprospiraceae bacterium]